MAKRYFSVLILIFTAWIANYSVESVLTPETRLLRDLKVDYDVNVRPVLDPNAPMDVAVYFSLKRIESLDERAQILNSFGWLELIWMDELLRWSPAEYNNTQRLVVPGSAIWLPEVAMYNSVDSGHDLPLDVKFRAEIYHDGQVVFAPGFKWRTECRVFLTHFPFDTQTCNVTFVNWMYMATSLNFSVYGIGTDVYEENDEWTLVNASAADFVRSLEWDEHMPFAYFTVILKRKPMYYLLNVVLPCYLISMLSCLVFLLPSDSGEKISISITVLLSYTVILLMVSDITPRSGVTIPYITIYIIISMAQTSLILFLTVLFLSFYHHPGNKPVPGCARAFVFGFLATIFCMRNQIKDDVMRNATVVPVSTGDQAELRTVALKVHEAAEGDIKTSQRALPADVITYIRDLMEKDREKEEEDKFRAEWVALGKVLDQCMLWVFLSYTICAMIGFTVAVYFN